MESLDDKIFSALVLLEKTNSDLFVLMSRVKRKVSDTYPTARVSRQGDHYLMEIGKDWTERLDVFSLAALIEHELLHVIFEHISRDNKEPKNQRLANIAQDAVINDVGSLISQRNKLHNLLKSGVFLDDINKELGTTFNVVMNTSADIYEHLVNCSKKEQEGLNDSFDEGMGDSGDQGPSQSPVFSEKELDKITENLACAKDSKGRQKAGAAELGKYIGGIKTKQKEKTFFDAINHFLASKIADSKKASWKRPSRRYGLMAKGRVSEKTQKVLLGLDTSGSMLSEETILKINKVINSAITCGFSVDVSMGDTKEQDFKEDIDKVPELIGGGGTKLDFISNRAEDKAYDCLILVTDGEFRHDDISDKVSKKLVTLLTENDSKMTKGKVLYV